jgi:hypothetical protein
MLIGMTVPPGGRDDGKASERHGRGLAGTGTRPEQAGDSAGDATEQVRTLRHGRVKCNGPTMQ